MQRVRLGRSFHAWDSKRWCYRLTLTIGHRERCWFDITKHYGLRIRVFGLTLWNKEESHA